MVELFQPLTINNQHLFTEYFSRYPQLHSEYNFNTLLCWNTPYQYRWALVEKHLVIWISAIDVLLMPVGSVLTTELFLQISTAFRSKGYSGTYILTDKSLVAERPDLKEHFIIQPDRDLADYIYHTRNLAELSGRIYQKKRNLINQFEKQYPHYHTEKIQDNDLDIALHLSEEWCRQRNCDRVDFEEEIAALTDAFRYFTELSMQGVKLFEGKRFLAFLLFSRQNPDMCTVHFEKFDPSIKGIGQVINREGARYILENTGCSYINREQDLGLEGLRKAKLSYNPAYIYETVQLIPKTGG